MNHPTTIAVDLSKSVFEVAVSVKPGRVAERGRLSRSEMTRFFSQRPTAPDPRSTPLEGRVSRNRLRRWATAVRQRRGNNRAAVALANKLARIAWAVWTRNTTFRPAV